MNRSELEAWLAAAGIDTRPWGSNNAKTIADLAREIANGESTLQDDPPRRVVHVVQVVIPRGECVLVEVAQEFADGRVRRRDHLPSEKMLPDEDPVGAAQRCLKEELGLDADQLLGAPTHTNSLEKMMDSPSYPGLISKFTMHKVVVKTLHLPNEDFSTNNEAHAHGDPIAVSHWAWRPHSQDPY